MLHGTIYPFWMHWWKLSLQSLSLCPWGIYYQKFVSPLEASSYGLEISSSSMDPLCRNNEDSRCLSPYNFGVRWVRAIQNKHWDKYWASEHSVFVQYLAPHVETFRTNIETNTEHSVAQCLCNVWPPHAEHTLRQTLRFVPCLARRPRWGAREILR